MRIGDRLAGLLGRQGVAIGTIAVFALIPAITQDQYILGVWTFLLLNILVLLGLDLVLGYAGQLSLGQGLFVAVGAYASGLLTTRAGWSGWAAMPVGMAAAAVIAAVVAIPTLRLRGYYLAMVTLGFPIVFDAAVRVTSQWSGGSSGIVSIPRLKIGDYALRDPLVYYYVVLVFLAVALLIVWNLANGRLGLKLRAIHLDETAASARGIDVVRLKIGVFVGSAALAALSGSLYVHNVQFVAPDTFGLNYSITLVILLVVGGMGRIWGGILGAVVLGWLPEFLREAASWQPVIFGSILVLIMLGAPNGMAGLVRRRSFFSPREPMSGEREPFAKDEVVLAVRDAGKTFGGVKAVDGLSFEVRSGEIKSIIGPNGAGKSTALALVSGVIPLDRGEIELCGKRVENAGAFLRARAGLGRTFQHARLIPSLTVYENILMGASPLREGDEREASEVLHQVGLRHIADKFPAETNQYDQRLIEIGAALAADPRLLMLDEPGAGLSLAEIARLSDLLSDQRSRGRAVVLVDHIMNLVVAVSDTILVLNSGMAIKEGSPRTVIADPIVRRAYLGERSVIDA